MNHDSWLILEPTVVVSTINSDCFLYDTISKNKIEVRGSSEVIDLLNKLKETNNVTKYRHSSDSVKIYEFVELLRDNYMGDIIPIEISKAMPFQMTNIINIQRDETKLRTGDSNSLSLGEKIMSYLKEINIVLNNTKNEAFLANAYNQFPYCCTNQNNDKELNFNSITNFLSAIDLNTLSNVNIAGSDISNYGHIKSLIEYLEPFKLAKNLFLHIDILSKNISTYNSLLSDIKNKYWFKALIFVKAKNLDYSKIEECIKMLSVIMLKFRFHFIIEDEEDYYKTEDVIKKMNIKSFSISPYFNGENLDFFEKNVFLIKEDILSQELDLKRINMLKKMNSNFFGKLYIDNLGKAYTNVNLASVGTIDQVSASDILHTELDNKRSWFDVKVTDKVCSSCLYNSICPPKSNYEYFLNKSNLCTVN